MLLISFSYYRAGKHVIREVIKDEEIVLEVNRFNTNMLMNMDVDGDGSYEDTSQRKNSSKTSKSQSQSSISTSNEQVCKIMNITYCFNVVILMLFKSVRRITAITNVCSCRLWWTVVVCRLRQTHIRPTGPCTSSRRTSNSGLARRTVAAILTNIMCRTRNGAGKSRRIVPRIDKRCPYSRCILMGRTIYR